MKSTICCKCGSGKIIPDVRAGERGVGNVPMSIAVRVDENPDAVVFKGMHAEDLKAWICGDCGYVEFFVANPQQLFDVYSRSQLR
jgi:ribosomal protein S27AE